MITSIEADKLRRILHRLRSDAHIAQAFARREHRQEDPVAEAYHEGEAAGIMKAVALIEQHAQVPRPVEARAEGGR